MPSDPKVSIEFVKSEDIWRTNYADFERRRMALIESIDDRNAHLVGPVEMHAERGEIEHNGLPTAARWQGVAEESLRSKVRGAFIPLYLW